MTSRIFLAAGGIAHAGQEVRAFGLQARRGLLRRLGLALEALDLGDGYLLAGDGAGLNLVADRLGRRGRRKGVEYRWSNVSKIWKPIVQILCDLHHVVSRLAAHAELGIEPSDEPALHLRHVADFDQVAAVLDHCDGGTQVDALGHGAHLERPLTRQSLVVEAGHLGAHARSSAIAASYRLARS